MGHVNESQRSRAAARDRGLRRASRTTGAVAVGGVAATALAAVVFAQSPAGADTSPAVADDPPVLSSPAAPGPPAGATGDAPAPVQRSGSTRHARGGSGGQWLQPPATPVAPPVVAHSHVRSGAS